MFFVFCFCLYTSLPCIQDNSQCRLCQCRFFNIIFPVFLCNFYNIFPVFSKLRRQKSCIQLSIRRTPLPPRCGPFSELFQRCCTSWIQRPYPRRELPEDRRRKRCPLRKDGLPCAKRDAVSPREPGAPILSLSAPDTPSFIRKRSPHFPWADPHCRQRAIPQAPIPPPGSDSCAPPPDMPR